MSVTKHSVLALIFLIYSAGALLYSRSFLEVKRYHPFLDVLLRTLTVIEGLCVPLSMLVDYHITRV